MNDNNDNSAKLFCSVDEIAAIAGVSRRTVWRDVKRGHCPRPLHIGAQACWSLHAARAWIANRRREAMGKPLTAIPNSAWCEGTLPEFVSEEELSRLAGLSRRNTRSLVESGDFPKPVKPSERPRLWRATEVVAWLYAVARTEERVS
jgi:predicted DNA-binding transcriptional regulator AlpA